MTAATAGAAAAADRLTTALVRLTHRRRRPRCADPVDAELWLSEDPTDRARAAGYCSGCPVLVECRRPQLRPTAKSSGYRTPTKRPTVNTEANQDGDQAGKRL